MTTPAHPFIAYDNRFADATPTASTTAAGYAAVNLSDFRPYRQWKPTALPATVTVNSGTAKSADSLSVYSHNLHANGCTIEVHGSTDNFAASDVTVATTTPANDSPFVLNFTSASYRYWRIRITGSTAPTLSICVLGVGITFEVGLQYGFSPRGTSAIKQFNISETGQPLGGATMFEEWKKTLSFPVVTPAWIRSTFIPAWTAQLRDGMFLFAWKLSAYPAEIYLVNSGGTYNDPPISPDYCSLSFEVKGSA